MFTQVRLQELAIEHDVEIDGRASARSLMMNLRDSRIDEYVRDKQIEYLADWPFILEELFVDRAHDPDPLREFEPVYSNGEVQIYRVVWGSRR